MKSKTTRKSVDLAGRRDVLEILNRPTKVWPIQEAAWGVARSSTPYTEREIVVRFCIQGMIHREEYKSQD